MAVKTHGAHNSAYGIDNALQSLAPQPIVARRDPTARDAAALGTVWANKVSGSYFVLTSVSGGSSTWAAQATGSGSFPSVTVTGGAGTVLTVNAGGNTSLGGTLAVTGVTTLSSDIDVTGDAIISGEIILAGVNILSGAGTPNAVVTAAQGSLYLRTDGSSTSTRMYINTDGGTTWTNVVTAA